MATIPSVIAPNQYFIMEPFLLGFLIPCILFLHLIASLFMNPWLIKFVFARIHHYSKNPKINCTLKNPKFLWPILGFFPRMGNLAHRNLACMASTMGATRLMSITLGSTPTIVSSHPDTAKEILCGSAFCDRPTRESAHLLMFDRAIGFSPSGNYWRHLRKIATTHMFSPKSVSALEGRRQSMAKGMVERVKKMMSERGVVEVREVVQKGSLESVVESVFGSVGRERVEEIGLMVKQGYEVMGDFHLGEYFGLGFLGFGWSSRRKKCHELGCRVRVCMGEIVRERREIGDFKVRDDFLSVLLSLPKDEQLCDLDMVAVLWEMVFRGVDNIAILLEWALARMVLHQDVQLRLQHEIQTTIPSGAQVQDSDIPNLPYLQATVKEVLRLHPPGPLLSWARLAIHDVHVDNCLIPAGTTAMVNMWAIAHDPSIWAEPWAFNPNRFLGQEFSITGSDLRLAPFGSGRRACPGRAMGLAAVHVSLARMLQEFRWIPSETVDLGECLKLSLELKKPLKSYAFDRFE